MNLLLDTHAFLWWLARSPRLKEDALRAIADPSSVVNVSSATIWEIAIKVALGRIQVESPDLVGEIQANGFVDLPITAPHAFLAGSLPRHHEDPFDRMLVAQAMLEGLVIVTHDQALAAYGVPILRT